MLIASRKCAYLVLKLIVSESVNNENMIKLLLIMTVSKNGTNQILVKFLQVKGTC